MATQVVHSATSRAFRELDCSSLSFLVVDDQSFSRRIVRSILLGFGSRDVYEAANGVDALEVLRTTVPSIIITDLVMPVFNGLQLINILRCSHSAANKIPVIVLSGYLTRTALFKVRSSGASELLAKPVAPKALYDRIASVVLRKHRSDQGTRQGEGVNELSFV
jgi:two-component system, chemotaxis family, chemotaxis protein CheY